MSFARKAGHPIIYIAANSGANIGISKFIMDCYKIKWNDESDPKLGYEYLYLNPKDFDKYKSLVKAVPIFNKEGTKEILHYKLISIIGENDGGVENLSVSGQMAGEFSRAYEEVFTCSIVTLRAVGIGAYLARLGQRVIQVENSPLLLTGFRALNDLLGRDVYIDNVQLGGPQVMHFNGITHSIASNDLNAVMTVLRWLSYVPANSRIHDPMPDFNIIEECFAKMKPCPEYFPENRNFSVRNLINGFFDCFSFDEIMDGWAKSIVAGRATLGSVPIGIIASETQSTELIVPSDPADSKSEEQKIQVAGRVLFPDSSFKIAQVISFQFYSFLGIPG